MYIYEMMDVHKAYHHNHDVYKSNIILYTLNLYSAVCQLYLNWKKKFNSPMPDFLWSLRKQGSTEPHVIIDK